ncbi:MAG: MFS transporter [Candidatus Kapabacteria bacterium]|nr:MFS transporter [Candidatus Kapabacteria bacterium]
MTSSSTTNAKVLSFPVLVAALGYFVDMYDLLLFGIVRVPSLRDLGVAPEKMLEIGTMLLNMQMIGMLFGGILWGILGDKKGRVSVLFGSILLYSIANVANAFVPNVFWYSVARVFAGIGLAGELGVAVTLVSEILPKEKRGYGTAIVASVGIMGSVTAAIVGDYLHWNWAYIVGGALGFLLLVLRFKIMESGIFSNMKNENVKKGDFIGLFTNKKRFIRYIKCILIGLPTWFVIGILITFSPEFGRFFGLAQPIAASKAIMFSYSGLVIGGIISGFGSQMIRSRKKILWIFLVATYILTIVYLYLEPLTVTMFYGLCFCIGLGIGYWSVFVTVGAEQFGTNLRATVATTVPNFVRGATVLITSSFTFLITGFHFSMANSALLVGSITFIIAFIALSQLEETFDKDLDYLEEY